MSTNQAVSLQQQNHCQSSNYEKLIMLDTYFGWVNADWTSIRALRADHLLASLNQDAVPPHGITVLKVSWLCQQRQQITTDSKVTAERPQGRIPFPPDSLWNDNKANEDLTKSRGGRHKCPPSKMHICMKTPPTRRHLVTSISQH